MSDINTLTISGNLTRDAKALVSTSGKWSVRFTIAHDVRKMVKGEWKTVPMYLDCVKFNLDDSGLANYLVKGRKVTVSGKLEQDAYDYNGNERKSITCIVSQLLLGELPKGQRTDHQQPEPTAKLGNDPWNKLIANRNKPKEKPQAPSRHDKIDDDTTGDLFAGDSPMYEGTGGFGPEDFIGDTIPF